MDGDGWMNCVTREICIILVLFLNCLEINTV